VPVSLSLAVAPIGGIESERGSPKVAKRATKIARAPSCNLSYLSATFDANDRGSVPVRPCPAWRRGRSSSVKTAGLAAKRQGFAGMAVNACALAIRKTCSKAARNGTNVSGHLHACLS
jgi:hypothetical protein